MKNKDYVQKLEKYSAHNYAPLPVVLSRGDGAKVWDVEGKEYIDFLACYSALNFGHGHPSILQVLQDQASQIALTSRAFCSKEMADFCEDLSLFCQQSFSRASVSETRDDLLVLPMNSGAEAVETTLKAMRKWGYETKGIPDEQAEIIVMENNFHGRTVTIVSFSSEPSYRNGFGPFTPGFHTVPFGDAAALERSVTQNTVGVLLEPIQAEAGILIPPAGYLKEVRAICDRHHILLALDEIQTGLCRTGKNFCFEHEGISPDVLILGKSLGGGLLPISATIARREVLNVFQPGQHGSTFGGNPLACAVGSKVISLLKDGHFALQADSIGKITQEVFKQMKSPWVKEIRGRGALIGIELYPEAGGARKYCEALMERGVLCKETHDHVIRIAPPLVIKDSELRQGLAAICDVLQG